MTEAVFKATFADFRLIKGRKQAQFVFEVPIEGADLALDALGGLPRGDESRWVAVARLNATGSQPTKSDKPGDLGQAPPAVKERQRWDDMIPSKRAAILCNDPIFQEWIAIRNGNRYDPTENEDVRKNDAATYLRLECGIHSRAELNREDSSPYAAFDKMENSYLVSIGRRTDPR